MCWMIRALERWLGEVDTEASIPNLERPIVTIEERGQNEEVNAPGIHGTPVNVELTQPRILLETINPIMKGR